MHTNRWHNIKAIFNSFMINRSSYL
jgi:hypothetical protein